MSNFNFSTTYLGLQLKNPLIISACSKTRDISLCRRFEELGASAIVLPSLFEEEMTFTQDQMDRYFLESSNLSFEGQHFSPASLHEKRPSEEEYLTLIQNMKKSLSIPVIASLNAYSPGGWANYARRIEEAQADALELNIYFVATDPEHDAFYIEQRYLDIISQVRATIKIPLTVKVSPFFSSFANMAKKIEAQKVQGIVLFNRFLEPDFDLEQLEVNSTLEFSHQQEMKLSLNWAAILYKQTRLSLCVGRGVKSSQDFIKLLLAGADCVSIASVLYQDGPQSIKKILDESFQWFVQNDYQSIEQLKGSMSLVNVKDKSSFERANYMKILKTKFD